MFLRKRKTLFVLILVGLLSAAAGGCGKVGPAAGADAGAADADADSDADGDSDADADSDADSDTGSETDTGTEPDTDSCTSDTVDEPPPGTAATPEAICAPAGEAVVCNAAAEVVLQLGASNPDTATGSVEVPPALLERVVGLPQIQIVDATSADLLDGAVTGIAASGAGFSFDVAWPAGAVPWWAGDTSLTFEVVIEVTCDEGAATATKLVSSTTYVDLCSADDLGNLEWVSSGGECNVCENITDPADMPPTVDRGPDGIALPGSIDLEIVPVVSFGRSLVLVAETHGHTRPLAYSWRASAGTLSARDEGGVVWRLPREPGPHFVQVAADDGDSVAVATFVHEHAP